MEVDDPVSVRCSALVAREDTVLLCHRRKDGVWVLPGGSPRRAESVSDCAVREVLQETGIQIQTVGIAFAFDVISPDDKHLLEIVFSAAEVGASKSPCRREENLNPEFVRVDRLSQLELRPAAARTFALRVGPASARNWPAPYLGNLWVTDEE